MASNKKWIIGGSITLLILLGASLGTGALIGYYNREDENRITIHLGNEVYDQPIDLGTDITSDEEKATLLEKQFYSAALYGSFAGTNSSEDDVISPNYILNQKEGVELDWNLPYIVTNESTTPEKLQDEFIKVKFLSQTEDSSVYSFLTGLSSTVNDQALLMQTIATLLKEASEVEKVGEDGEIIEGGIPFPSVTGLDVIEGDDFEDTRALIFELLSTDPSYIKDVQKDILVYTYLWQEPSQNAYDYIITRELVYSSPSIVYSMKIDGEEADLNDVYNDEIAKKTKEDVRISKDEWNGYISEFKGDVLIDDTIDQNDLVEGGMQGYEGIKFGTSAGTNVSSDWTKWDNTWIADEVIPEDHLESDGNYSHTKEGNYSHTNILTSANLYIADKANGSSGEGAAIFDDSSDETNPNFGSRTGERTIYAYSQLYPYVFRDVESQIPGGETDDILGNESFSLFANGDSTIGYTPATSEEHEKYIFDEWFADKSIQGEIYVAEALVGNNSSLMTNALRYWNDQGFYIELSGSYEDDLASYLPEEILFNE